MSPYLGLRHVENTIARQECLITRQRWILELLIEAGADVASARYLLDLMERHLDLLRTWRDRLLSARKITPTAHPARQPSNMVQPRPTRPVDHYILAERHLATARVSLSRQTEIVSRMHPEAPDRDSAEALLVAMKRAIGLMLAHRNMIVREIAHGTDRGGALL